jgi:hypothetical protein
MALLGKSKLIISCHQMQAYGADIINQPHLTTGAKQAD